MKLKNKFLLYFGAAFLIILLYFFLRIFNILNLPLFTDEAIYIRWAQIAKQDANWRFISLVDGKQPMFIWIAAVIMKFVKDPLLAGRLVSTFAGFATTIGLFFLGNEVFREKSGEYRIFSFTKTSVSIGFVSSFIYVIYPFGLVYDRMALYDSLVGTFAVWSLYLLFVVVRSLRLDAALLAGIVVGGGLLTKTNAFFSLYSIPFLIALFDFGLNKALSKLAKFAVLALVIVLVSNSMYSILRLSPFYHIINEKNALFVYPVSEWIRHPFTYFYSNLHALIDWLATYMKIPVIILILASFFLSKKYLSEKIVLSLWFVFPFTALAFFGNQIYPRFILFMTLPLIPLFSFSLYQLLEKYKNFAVRTIIIVSALGLYVYADYFILFNFSVAPIPRADLGQYVNDWTAGNGVKQSVDFFRKQAESQKIYIATEGTFGLMPYGLEMYLVDNPNITINAIWPIKDSPPEDLIAVSRKMPTYAIFYQPCPACFGAGNIPRLWHAKLIAKYKQGTGNSYYGIYRMLP